MEGLFQNYCRRRLPRVASPQHLCNDVLNKGGEKGPFSVARHLLTESIFSKAENFSIVPFQANLASSMFLEIKAQLQFM